MSARSALDDIDRHIVAALQRDARLSNKELAAQIGLAPSSCLERVRRLRASGVLRGFHADVDPKAVGVGIEAMASVRLAQHKTGAFDTFLEYVRSLEEVVAIYQVAGADDFLIHVAVRDTDHLRQLIVEGLSARDEVSHIETSLIFQHVHNRVLPSYG